MSQENPIKSSSYEGLLKELYSLLDNSNPEFQGKNEKWFRDNGWEEIYSYRERDNDHIKLVLEEVKRGKIGFCYIVSVSPDDDPYPREKIKILFRKFYTPEEINEEFKNKIK